MATFTDSFNAVTPDLTWTQVRGDGSLTLNGGGTASLPGVDSWQFARATADTGAPGAMFAETVIAQDFSGGTNVFALLLLGLGSGESSSAYGVVLNQQAGWCTIIRYPSGWNPATNLTPDTPVVFPSTPFTFRAELDGATIRVLVNGAPLARADDGTPFEVTDPGAPLTGAYGGLGVRAGGTLVRYDSFRVGGLADVPPAAPVVDAGADATIALGAAFTRTATETGAPTSRLWSILSGPAEQGATLATTAALTWTPTAAGTYVLRYSATNAQGTGSDDVTVTVTDPGAGGGTRVNLTENPALTVGNDPQWYGPTGSPGRVTGLAGMTRTTGFSASAGGSTTARWPVTAGLVYASSVEIDPGYSGNFSIGIDYYDTSGWIGGDSTTVAVTDGVVQRVGVIVAAPAGAVEAVSPLNHTAGPAVFTAHLAEQADSLGDYFDGDTEGAAWDDGAPPSTSSIAVEAPHPQLVATYTAEAVNAPATLTTESFTPRENEVIVVKAIAGDEDVTIGLPTSGTGLSWTNGSNRTDVNYTAMRTFTAVVGADPGPMTVTVPFTRSAGTAGRSPTLIVERWAYAAVVDVGSGVGPTGGGVPATNYPVSVPDGAVTWVFGDWVPDLAADGYRADAVENYKRRTSAINVWSGYTEPATAASTPIGMTAPPGAKWTVAAVQLEYGPAPVENPSGPDTAAERYGWGAPLDSSDEFDVVGGPDPAKWSLYDGPGHNDGDGPNGTRDPERINVIAGTGPDDPASFLRIEGTADGSTGGMAHLFDQQYGRWEVRARWDAFTPGSAGGAYHAVLIVWPQSDEWPEDGEYDWVEIADVEQTSLEAYLHFPHPDGPVEQIHETAESSPGVPRVFDFSQWHNYAFEWVEGALKGYVDGDEWFTLDGALTSSNGRRLDSMPAGHLTIQLDNFTGDTGLQPAYMDLAWARVYTAEGSTQVGSGVGTTSAALDQAATGDKTTTGDGGTLVDLATTGTGGGARSSIGDPGPVEVAAHANPGTRTTPGAGTDEATLAASGAGGASVRAGTGTAGVVLGASGRGQDVHGAVGAATLDLALDTLGHGATATRAGTGTAGLTLAATSRGHGGRATTATTGTVLAAAAGSGAAARTGSGAGGLAVDVDGIGAPAPRAGAGVAGSVLAAGGTGQAATAGDGRTGGVLGQAGTGTGDRATTGATDPLAVTTTSHPGPVARTGAAPAAVALDQHGDGPTTRHGAGTAGVALGGYGGGFPGGAGRAHTGLRLAATGAGAAGPRTGDSTTEASLAAIGDGHGVRTTTGATASTTGTAGTGHRGVTASAAASVSLAATGEGRPRTITGGGTVELALDRRGGGARGGGGTAPAGVVLAAVGDGVRAATGAATTATALAAAGGGPRTAAGRGHARLAVGDTATGTRTTTGGGGEQLTLARDTDDGDKTTDGTGHPGAIEVDTVGDGAPSRDGTAHAGMLLDRSGTPGPVARPGTGGSVHALAAAGAGRPGPRAGGGRARLRAGAGGTGRLRTRGVGATGLRLTSRPRRVVPGRRSRAWHDSNAGTRASHGPRQEANSAR